MNNLLRKIVVSGVILSLAVVALPALAAVSAGCKADTSTCTSAEMTEYIAELIPMLTALQARVATLAPTTPTTPTAYEGIPAGFTFEKNLKLGMLDADVVNLKIVLGKEGLLSGVTNNTYFGSKTLAAVKAFQTKYSADISAAAGYTIKANGFVGTGTRTKLNALLAGAGTTTTTFPAGCTSAVGFSPTTGQSCAATSITTTPATITTFPAGCTSAIGFSTITGQSCAATTPVTAGLTVALASDTPAAGMVLMGEANRVVAKVDFAAASDADTKITSLTVKSFGTARLAAEDIANVKVLDGTTQIGLTQGLIAGQATFVFAPALTITKGTVKTLDIAVTIAAQGTAQAMATVKMGVETSASVGGATFTGTFPVVGNPFNIVPGGSLGTLNVTAGAVVPIVSTNVGAKDVVLGNFVVSSGPNEDVDVTQFNVSYGGGATIIDSDVTNVRVKVDGVLQGNAVNFSMRRATIDFASAIRISKGTSRTFQVIGDISTGVARTVELRLESNAVFARGVTSGVGLGGPAAAFPLGVANRITLTRGSIALAVSSASPQGTAATVVKSTVAQVLGVYDIRAVGEDILMTAVNLVFPGGAGAEAGTIDSVGLYNEGGALLSNLVPLTADAGNNRWGIASNAFTLSWTIPGNTTQKLYVKGITNNITGPSSAIVNVQLVQVTGNSIVASGMQSSGTEGANNITSASQLPLPALTINQGPIFAVVGNALVTPRNQGILAPVSQATIASIKVTAQRENQSLRTLILTGVTSTVALASYVSGVAIFDGTTQITNFVAPGVNTVVFSSTDIITPVNFTKDTAKTLKIVANVLDTADGTLYWTIAASDLTTTGLTSGQIGTSTAADLRVNSGGLGVETGGIVTAYDDILEIKKAASSPSGDVARNTFATHAIYELDARGTLANLTVDSITFTSRTGLPAALIADTTRHTFFRLYDLDNGIVLADVDDAAHVTATTVIFNDNFTVTAGTTLRVALQVTTVSTILFPAATAIHWTVNEEADVALTTDGAGYGGTVWSIPADANSVRIPN